MKKGLLSTLAVAIAMGVIAAAPAGLDQVSPQAPAIAASPAAPADHAFGPDAAGADGLCYCGTRSDGRGGCGDVNDGSCDNPACQTDDDCDPGRFCAINTCCPNKPNVCIGICPEGPACSNPGDCDTGFQECRSFQSSCRYQDKKVKAKGGCRACPEPQPCGYDSGVQCDDVRSCNKKLKTEQPCPDGRPGFCKIKRKRCDCA